MESPNIPLYKQSWFWIGLAVLLVLAVGILVLKRQSQPPLPVKDQVLTREDLLKALSAGAPQAVSDKEREELAQKLTSPKPQNVTQEDRNKLLELLK